MKTQNQRLIKIAQKMDIAQKLEKIAKTGLSSANKKNPFWSKSDAMKSLNNIRKIQRQLSKIWILEQQV